MKVYELIEKLGKFDKNANVMTSISGECIIDTSSVIYHAITNADIDYSGYCDGRLNEIVVVII